MRAIFTIVCAGIRKNKLQTIAFAAGCFLCAFLLLGVFVLHFTIEPSFNNSYHKLNAPNTTICIGETEQEYEKLQKFMKECSYIESYQISKRHLASNVKTAQESMEFAFLASSHEIEIDFGKAIVNKGTHCMVGEQVEISINGNTIVLEVEEVIIDAVNSAPDAMVPYFWINDSLLESLTEGYEKGDWLIEANVLENGTYMESAFASDYEKYFGYAFHGEVTLYEEIKDSYLFRYEIFGMFFLLLSLFLFCIMIVMTVLFSQMAVSADMRKIGVLKSYGFTNAAINMIYSLRYGLIATIFSGAGVCLSGIVLKIWLSGIFVNIQKDLFQIQRLGYYQIGTFLIVCAVFYVTVYLSIHNIINISPIDAILAKQKIKKVYVPDISLPMPRFIFLNLAMITAIRRKLESVFIFVLTLGISLLILMSFYLMDSVKNADIHLADWGMVEMDVYVSRKTNVDEEESGLLKALQKELAVDFYYAALSDTITYQLENNGLIHNVVGDVYDKYIPNGLEYIFIEGRNPKNTKEAAVGINFAKQHNLGVGDTFYVIRNGEKYEQTIVGIYPSLKQYGNSIRIVTNDIKAFFGDLANGYYSIVLKEDADRNAFIEKISKEFPDFDFFLIERNTTYSVRMLFPPIAVCLSLFIGIFMVILLCMKKLMMMECKDMLKNYYQIGFSKKKIKAILQWRFDIPIFLGMGLAVPLSIYALPKWMQPLAQQLGLAKIPIYPNVLLVGIALVLIYMCSRIQAKIKC